MANTKSGNLHFNKFFLFQYLESLTQFLLNCVIEVVFPVDTCMDFPVLRSG